MLVVTTIRLSKGFQAWKDMVHSVGDKMKEHGMTFVFAGTQKDDDNMLHTVIHFESEANRYKLALQCSYNPISQLERRFKVF